MKLVVVDYGAGNLRSITRAMEVLGEEIPNFSVNISHNPAEIAAADRIILPGDGAYPDCRNSLIHSGLEKALTAAVINRRVPFLGICVGMQLLSTIGVEHGETKGLNWIEGSVKKLELKDKNLKIPHMGWNTLESVNPHRLLNDVPVGDYGLHAYFLHSYHFIMRHPENLIATTHYGMPITAIIAKQNIAGVQFHPEKSQKLGLKLLSNFLKWTP